MTLILTENKTAQQKDHRSFFKCHIEVNFIEGLSSEEIVETLNLIERPQIVFWYIGCKGLRKGSVDFYRDSFISPILKQNNNPILWLVDLTAWAAFKSRNCSITSVSRFSNLIEQVDKRRIKCLRSASIFNRMKSIRDSKTIDYFRTTLKRSFISTPSRNFLENNGLLGEILSYDCPILADWYHWNSSNAYSICQYLEGCLIVEEIVFQLYPREEYEKISIAFVLPNDELKYYKDDEDSFKKDVQHLLSNRISNTETHPLEIDINFFSFTYGDDPRHRPYNSPGRVLKKNDFFSEIIAIREFL